MSNFWLLTKCRIIITTELSWDVFQSKLDSLRWRQGKGIQEIVEATMPAQAKETGFCRFFLLTLIAELSTQHHTSNHRQIVSNVFSCRTRYWPELGLKALSAVPLPPVPSTAVLLSSSSSPWLQGLVPSYTFPFMEQKRRTAPNSTRKQPRLKITCITIHRQSEHRTNTQDTVTELKGLVT